MEVSLKGLCRKNSLLSVDAENRAVRGVVLRGLQFATSIVCYQSVKLIN